MRDLNLMIRMDIIVAKFKRLGVNYKWLYLKEHPEMSNIRLVNVCSNKVQDKDITDNLEKIWNKYFKETN